MPGEDKSVNKTFSRSVTETVLNIGQYSESVNKQIYKDRKCEKKVSSGSKRSDAFCSSDTKWHQRLKIANTQVNDFSTVATTRVKWKR